MQQWRFSSSARVVGWLFLCLALTACRQTNAPALAPITTATPTAPSPVDTVKHADIGFASRQKWLDHFHKHGREFGNVTAEEYLRQAQTLRDRTTGGDILESVRRDSTITRFDKQSGAFLAFNDDLTIRTYFKPNDGANYFWRQARR